MKTTCHVLKYTTQRRKPAGFPKLPESERAAESFPRPAQAAHTPPTLTFLWGAAGPPSSAFRCFSFLPHRC